MKYILIAALGIFIMGCSDGNSSSDQADIQFRLTDMPGEYQQVNIDVVAVHIIHNDTLVELNSNPGIYNLLEFVNGKDTLLADDEIPAGYISQVRLILGENNSIMVDSLLSDLKTPSAQQSGLKLNVHAEIVPGESYAYVIDFVVEKSIVETGNGKYILKPVIRVYTEAVTGSIEGVVTPAEARPSILAIGGGDTTSTNADTVTGNYMIRGLQEGAYTLEFHPVEAFNDTTLTNITVVNGQTTRVDTVAIQ